MDTARNKYTKELVEAEELWNMETVDSDAYTCRGCSIQVFPASYDKARNKKRPYFSLGPVNEHEAGCDVDGEAKAIKRAQKERLGTPEGFPVPFPSKLTLTDERPSEKSGADSPGDPADGQARSRSVGVGPTPKRHHGHTVKTIRPASRAFINFPNDRDSLPLDIPGVPGKTYAKVFWYIASKSPEPFQMPVHLYYAPIRWKADPVVADTHCELTLNSGEWDAAKNSFKSLYRIKGTSKNQFMNVAELNG